MAVEDEDSGENRIQGQKLSAEVKVPFYLSGQSIQSFELLYPLRELDFVRLTGPGSRTATISGVVLSGVVGYLISLSPKASQRWIKGEQVEVISEAEIILLGLITFSAAIIYLVGMLFNNDKQVITKRIKRYYQTRKMDEGDSK